MFFRIPLFLAVAGSLLLQACGALSRRPHPSPAPSSLATQITTHIEQPRFAAASWGIQVVSLDTGRPLFEHNAQKYFVPASNAKLYSGALALDALGPDYRILTELYATAPPRADGVLAGDLVLYGRGDPTLGAAANPSALSEPFDHLAEQLARIGVKRVRGKLLIDDSAFDCVAPSGWAADDLQWSYGAPVCALNFRENAFALFIHPAPLVGQPCLIVKDMAAASSPSLSIVNLTRTTLNNATGTTGIGVYRKPGTQTLYVFGSLAIGDAPRRFHLSDAAPIARVGTEILKALSRQHIKVDGPIQRMGPSPFCLAPHAGVPPSQDDWQARSASVKITPEASKSLFRNCSKRAKDLRGRSAKTFSVHGDHEDFELRPTPYSDRAVGLWIDSKCVTRSQQPWYWLAGISSPPLADILQQTLKRSQNLYAQDLLLQVGRVEREARAQAACIKDGLSCTTEQWGIEALNTFLAQAGVTQAKGRVLLEEGSGLSRGNLLTPSATTTLLRYMSRHRAAQAFRNALPIAGVDGTLKDRMGGTAAQNNARAKTGTLAHTYALSGYVSTAAKERLAFSIMLNNYDLLAGTSASEDIDAIVVMLAEFTGHS